METEKGQFIKVWRSFDKGDTFVGPEYVPVTGPPLGNISTPQHGLTLFDFISSSMVELDDGTLLTPACIRFKNDTKERTVIYRSTDRGKSFHYYSTMAIEPDYWQRDDFGEPNIELLANGDLISIQRVGNFVPLWQCYSTNGGATWSEPLQSPGYGVSPVLVRMSNGILACTYGRPGCWIMFSPDGKGKTWVERTCIYNEYTLTTYDYGYPGPLDKRSHPEEARQAHYSNSLSHDPKTPYNPEVVGHVPKRRFDKSDCYCPIREISPGRLLFLFTAPTNEEDTSATNVWDPDQTKKFSIWGVNIDVKRQ